MCTCFFHGHDESDVQTLVMRVSLLFQDSSCWCLLCAESKLHAWHSLCPTFRSKCVCVFSLISISWSWQVCTVGPFCSYYLVPCSVVCTGGREMDRERLNHSKKMQKGECARGSLVLRPTFIGQSQSRPSSAWVFGKHLKQSFACPEFFHLHDSSSILAAIVFQALWHFSILITGKVASMQFSWAMLQNVSPGRPIHGNVFDFCRNRPTDELLPLQTEAALKISTCSGAVCPFLAPSDRCGCYGACHCQCPHCPPPLSPSPSPSFLSSLSSSWLLLFL